MASDNEKIFVETSFANIIIVNPNKVYNDLKFPEDRYVKHENLIMYANLQCNLQPRSRLLVGEDFQTLETIATTSINFLKPNGTDFMTTSWTEEPGLTGGDSSVINSELLGITNITQKMTAKNISTVDIQLEDIRGRALFEGGNSSVYSAFFNLPYPTFYLTLKGYYGKALRYPLILQKFQASFDSASGNFLVSLNFIGYKYNVLGDIAMGYLEAIPNMYLKETTQNLQIESSSSVQSSVGQINNTAVVQNTATVYMGYEKLKEVFDIYKSKGLIAQDFPVMSVQELVVRLDYFERDVLANFGSVNIDKLTDGKNFSRYLKEFNANMTTAKEPVKSWQNEYLGQLNYFITISGEKIYTYKPKFVNYDDAISDLNNRIKNNLDIISKCPTFGSSGNTGNEVIDVQISSKDIIVEPFPTSQSDINFIETAKKRLGKQQLLPGEEEQFILEFNKIIETQNAEIQRRQNADPPVALIEVPFFFQFEGKDKFEEKIYKYQKILATKVKNIEEQLTSDINTLIASDKGIGFNPSIRNIFAVIFASADAFLRMMNEVHVKAWNERMNPNKKKSVQNDVQEPVNENPVYPWPQFQKEEFTEDGQVKYDLKYPGGDYAEETGAVFPYTFWPEVEFVEEFIRGFTLRQQIPLRGTPTVNNDVIDRALIAGYDDLTNLPYSADQDIKILYELWERIQSIANYTGFVREKKYDNILNLLQAYEASNLIIGLGQDDPSLSEIYKQTNFGTPPNPTYLDYIYRASNEGIGNFWTNLQYGNVNTAYLNEELQTPSKLIKENLPNVNAEVKTEPNLSELEKQMAEYLANSDKNSSYFTDTYPYIIPDWNYNNLVFGQQNYQLSKVLSTSSTLFFNKTYKKIFNFEENVPDINKIRPFYKFIDLSETANFVKLTTDYKTFFSERYDNTKKQSFTEILLDDVSSNLDGAQTTFTKKTTSILNSPLFMNAIQIGVQKDVSPESNRAYTEAAFLFLNSLPLSSPSNPYLDSNGNLRNYIGPSLKKYGAIHSLPKMFICKIGAIWHRYKTFIESGTDILAQCMTPFNKDANYDPINSDPTKVYKFLIDGSSESIILKDNKPLDTTTNIDILNVGFYPKLLKDFYFFLNGSRLYESDADIEIEIQEKINLDEVKLISADSSRITVNPPTPENNFTNALQFKTWSVLFKVSNSETETESNQIYYYSGPSFGSANNQTKYECFPNNVLIKDIVSNDAIFNGSARILWGVPNYGYLPTITEIPSPDEYFVKGKDLKAKILDSGIVINGEKIDDILGTFTFDELELFEQEFFDFSKPANRTTSEFNFHRIMRKALQVNLNDFNSGGPNSIVQNFQKKQEQNFNSVVNKYMNQNFYFQKGNPSNLNRKNLSYFATNQVFKIKGAEDGVQLYNTTPDSVPTGGTLTLASSESLYPEAWKALKLRVGFLNQEGFTYSDSGSFITQFFPDLNIAFTREMIERFSEEIKLYASKKWENSANTSFNFSNEVNNYFTEIDNFRNTILNGVLSKVKSKMPQYVNASNIDISATEGDLSKLEYYNIFKAINDKWVAGNNYNSETLFEDCLFLDRANRDVGNLVIVDLEKTKSYLKGETKTPLYFIINSIAEDSHFQPFSLPAYVNFYNVQNVGEPAIKEDDEDTVASKLFGTFNTVDYQDSKTKLVFVYTEVESEQMKNNNPKNGYLDDSFNMTVAPNNPLYDNREKTDIEKGLSNKVVGFAVDFGLQNQSVFTNIQVSQDLGKATSESLRQTTEVANTYRGVKGSTQSVSLYNIYKTRSYKAVVTSFGNVMIQPTMYFILRNVPLFAGPYFITDVEHTITEGTFTTKFTGTRQKLYTPPIENALLNTIKNTYLNKLLSDLQTKRETDKKLDANTISARNSVSNNIAGNFLPAASSICKPASAYETFTLTPAVSGSIADRNLYDLINSKYNNEPKLVYVIYTLFSVANYRNAQFNFYNNNISSTPIWEKSYGPSSFDKLNPNFVCLVGNDNQQQAFGVFKNLDSCVEFNYDRYKNDFQNIDINSEFNFISGFTKTWIEKVPYDKVGTDKSPKTKNLFDTYVTSNPTQYDLLKNKVRESYLRVKAYSTQ